MPPLLESHAAISIARASPCGISPPPMLMATSRYRPSNLRTGSRCDRLWRNFGTGQDANPRAIDRWLSADQIFPGPTDNIRRARLKRSVIDILTSS